VACGMAGIIVGMITLTGLGLKMGNGLVELAGGRQLLTLVLTMMASIILGMGVPTTANYLITSTIMAPAVVAVMGWSAADTSMVLVAHM
ncbi:MAG: TRAP transporter large permease subunit, partial [Clostridia bacterium]